MRGLEVIGKDACEFLHRICASNVKKINVGRGARGLLLNGQSKMIAQFDVLRMAEDVYWLISPEECFGSLCAELERMHFSENLERREMLDLFQIVAGESSGEEEFAAGERWPSAVPSYVVGRGDGALPSGFHSARIEALVPWPLLDWDESTNALEAGVLPWIDRYKGCYPGQEVVEKSLNVGHPARVLVAYEGVGERARLEEHGQVCSFVAGVKVRALVRVPWKKKDLPVPGFEILKKQF